MSNFGKLMTAMVTPFDKDLKVDYQKAQELALRLIKNKTTGLVLCGTTGESPTLSSEEKINIVKAVKEVSTVPIIAGTGSYDTRESVNLSQSAEQAGADALLVVNPYYNKPDQRGLYAHFKTIANSVSIPLILYNHPGRTGVSVEAETMAKLSEIDNIVAVKDSSGNLDLVCKYKELSKPGFKIYSGDDALNFPIYCLGGDGAVSVASHVAGLEIYQMFDFLDKGNIEDARKLHYLLIDLFKILFCAPSPAPTKAALRILGFDTGSVRLPLLDLEEDTFKKVNLVIDKLFNK